MESETARPRPYGRSLRWRTRDLRHRVRGTSDVFGVPNVHFWCDTDDGVRLAGTLLGERRSGTALVLAHGFAGFRKKDRNRLLAEALSDEFAVFAFDLRGHGQSGGSCSGGFLEALDVHAVVGHARRRGFERVVTVGWSLGGIAAVREAARFHDVDGLVTISTPAFPHRVDTAAVRRATWFFVSPVGRRVAHHVLGTRICLDLTGGEQPAELIPSVQAPILIVHGRDDHFFGAEEAEELYRRAPEPKRLLLLQRFGHAEDGFTREFAGRLVAEIRNLPVRPARPSPPAPTAAATPAPATVAPAAIDLRA